MSPIRSPRRDVHGTCVFIKNFLEVIFSLTLSATWLKTDII